MHRTRGAAPLGRPRVRRPLASVVALVCVALLAGCVSAPTAAAPSDPRSGAGLRYGLAPQRDQGVTFEKNVVLVDGGASAVRSVTADGLTWTLAPTAAGIADLAPGRVMFLTDRAVGTVRAVQTTKAGVEVTIAPAPLTDVIHDGRFASKQPIPLTKPVVVSSVGAFWADPALQKQAGVPSTGGADVPVTPAVFRIGPAAPQLPRPPQPPAVVADAIKTQTGAWDVTSKCCDTGPGSKFDYDHNGLTMHGAVHLNMSHPTATFALDIRGATFHSASLRLFGAGSISAQVHAVTQPNALIRGYSPPLDTNIAFSVPIGEFFGVPLNMVVKQQFTIGVDIPGTATLDASGSIKLGAVIAFSYANHAFHNDSKASFDSDAALKATNSIAVGISYAAFDYNVRITIGFGVAGFVVGVYVALATRLLGAVGAPIGFNIDQGAQDPIEHCRLVQAVVSIDYGVGYTIPTPVAAVINFFLKAFRSHPIQTSDGLSVGWHRIADTTKVSPNSGFCTQTK